MLSSSSKAIESTFSTINTNKKIKKIEGNLNLIKNSHNNKLQKLKEAFSELRQLRAAEKLKEQKDDIKNYFKWVKEIFDTIFSEKQTKNAVSGKSEANEDHKKLILRFLEITNSYAECVALVYPTEKDIFLEIIQGNVGKFLLQFEDSDISNAVSKVDWRLARKISNSIGLSVKGGSVTLEESAIIDAFIVQIQKSADYLIWQNPFKANIKACKALLEYLKFLCQEQRQKVGKAIMTGRFDKNLLSLKHGSLVLGEDGGLFLLLNNYSEENEEILKSNPRITSEYIKGKTYKDNKIKIGEGSFGTVKFAMSLFDNEKCFPGEIVCVKKTKSFEKIAGLKFQEEASMLTAITDSTIKDYLAGDVAEIIKAPIIYDLALLHHKDLQNSNKKGYLMMEVLPLNTADRIFELSQYKKWEYQKPYCLGVLKNIQELLDMLIVFTDLKPGNTLYDTNNRKPTMIDLGGTIKLRHKDHLRKFMPSEEAYEFTKEYCPPELNPDNLKAINLEKSMSYVCGKTIQKIFENGTDLNEEELGELNKVIMDMTMKNPDSRIDIFVAIKKIEKIGNDEYRMKALHTNYIEKLRDRINKDLSSLSLNENIFDTQQFLIEMKISKKDPSLGPKKGEVTFEIFDYINRFLRRTYKKKLLIVFGSAGAGKSIVLQLKFIQSVQSWTFGEPLPIYFNLANETDIKKIFDKMNQDLLCNIESGENMNVFIDSFDEGVDIFNRRETLFQEYQEYFGHDSKFIMTCRSEYVESENFMKWFENPGGTIFKYIVPMNLEEKLVEAGNMIDEGGIKDSSDEEEYTQESLIDQDIMKEIREKEAQELKVIEGMIARHDYYITIDGKDFILKEDLNGKKSLVEYDDDKNEPAINNWEEFIEYVNKGSHFRGKETYLEVRASDWIKYHKKDLPNTLYRSILWQPNLKKLIKNGFYFELVMQTIENLKENITNLNSYIIFKLYTENFMKRKINELSEEQAKKSLDFLRILRNEDMNENLHELLYKLNILIAIEICFSGHYRIDCSSSLLFKFLQYNPRRLFKEQTLYRVLSLLPLKIETKKTILNPNRIELIQIGFAHDTIKSYFMVESIFDSVRKNESSLVLCLKGICLNKEFTNMFRDALTPEMKETFIELICKTRHDKSDRAGVQSSNLISLLIMAGQQFSGADLSCINIKGANLANSSFSNTNFSGANLEGVDFRHSDLNFANFSGANLKNVKLDYMEIQLNLQKIKALEVVTKCKGGSSFRVRELFFADDSLEISITSANIIIVKHGNFLFLYDSMTGDMIMEQQLYDYHPRYWNDRELIPSKNLFTVDNNGENLIVIGVRYLILWNLKKGKLIKEFEPIKGNNPSDENKSAICSIAISGNGNYFAIGYEKNLAKIVSMKSLKVTQKLSLDLSISEEKSNIDFVALSEDGELFAACCMEKKVFSFWKSLDGKLIRSLNLSYKKSYSIESIKMCCKGESLAILYKGESLNNMTLKLWSSRFDKQTTIYGGVINDFSLSGSGNVLGVFSKNKIFLWNVLTLRLISSFILKPLHDYFIGKQHINLQKILLNYSGDKMIAFYYNKIVVKHLYPTSNIKLKKGYKYMLDDNKVQNIEKAGFINENKWFYVKVEEGYKISDCVNGSLLKTVNMKNITKNDSFYSEISPCGKYIAFATSTKHINGVFLYDIGTDQILSIFHPKGGLEKIVFTEDGSRLALCCANTSVSVWNITPRKEIVSIGDPNNIVDYVQNSCFSGDGNYFITKFMKNDIMDDYNIAFDSKKKKICSSPYFVVKVKKKYFILLCLKKNSK